MGCVLVKFNYLIYNWFDLDQFNGSTFVQFSFSPLSLFSAVCIWFGRYFASFQINLTGSSIQVCFLFDSRFILMSLLQFCSA